MWWEPLCVGEQLGVLDSLYISTCKRGDKKTSAHSTAAVIDQRVAHTVWSVWGRQAGDKAAKAKYSGTESRFCT